MPLLQETLGIQFSYNRWQQIFQEMDINSNGYVDLNEFIMACSMYQQEDSQNNSQSNQESDLLPANQQNMYVDYYWKVGRSC